VCLQAALAHGCKNALVFFRLKWPDAGGLISLDLNAGELRGGIGRDDTRVVAEFEERFHPFLIVPLAKRGFKGPAASRSEMGKGDVLDEEPALCITDRLQPVERELLALPLSRQHIV
jgi:hypothetical protein